MASVSALPEEFEDEKPRNTHSFFVESSEVLQILQEISNADLTAKNTVTLLGNATTSLSKIFDKYQEQPQLLDPHLEKIVTQLAERGKKWLLDTNNNARDQGSLSEQEISFRQTIFKVLYVLTKVRGYAGIVKHLPHEISELEGLFHSYVSIPSHEWETKYILLLWLSLIIINPFDLAIVDSSQAGNDLPTLMVEEGKNALHIAGKASEGAAIFLARLLIRPDMQGKNLPQFLGWCVQKLDSSNDPFLKYNITNAIGLIFKFGKREELIDKIPIIFSTITKEGKITNTLLRKMYIKLIQRVGLTFLKPRVAAWRYQKTRVSILKNLKKLQLTSLTANPNNSVSTGEDGDDDYDIPSEIEDVIDRLLNGLRDKDTIVRWSAAKGIGRTTMRLPQELGDDIVQSILELFSDNETDTAWHGGCLALAELARRGLLLPSRLSEVVPIIIKSLKYDERKGSHSVGSHVRDAACYVCWAFARAYSSEIMKPYVDVLAQSLVVMSVYDREVNCRRAAAAAFQENVGRQGNFPHGIDILTRADYFTLSNRNVSFLEISPFIAQYKEYCSSLIDDLLQTRSIHWDKALRELSSQTLSILTGRDKKYMIEKAIPYLIPLTTSSDLNSRHGSLLALAEITLSLSKNGETFSEDMQTKLRDVVPTIEAKRLYRGRGGEIMREAVCRFIECMALSNVNLPPTISFDASVGPRKIKKKAIKLFQETLDENLKHPNEEIIFKAVSAFKAFASKYYHTAEEIQAEVIDRYIKILKTDDNPAVRRGYVLALSVIPKHLVIHRFEDVRKIIASKTIPEDNPDLADAEARRNAVNALINLCENVGVCDGGISKHNVQEIFECFENATNDYAIDKRGDVGSWVREASMKALQRWAVLLCNSSEEELFTKEMSYKLLACILKQANEKIDRVRSVAGSVLQSLVMSEELGVYKFIQHVDNFRKLMEDKIKAKSLDWSSAETTFPMFLKLMEIDQFVYPILYGFLVSVGSLSAHVSKNSGDSLISYLKQIGKQQDLSRERLIASSLLTIMKNNQKNDRVIIPAFKSLSLLLSRGCFERLQPEIDPFTIELLMIIESEIKGVANISKLLEAVRVYCELIKFNNPTRNRTLSNLISLMLSKYPKLRATTGELLFSTIQCFTEEIIGDDEERADDIMEILMNTQWTGNVKEIVKPACNKLRDLLQLTSK